MERERERGEWRPAAAARDALENGKSVFVSGLYGSSRPFFISLLAKKLKGPLVVVTAGTREEKDFREDLRTFSPCPVHLFPARETMPDEGREHPDIAEDRLRVLEALSEGSFEGVIVTSVKAVLEKLPAADSLLSSAVDVCEGATVDLGHTVSRLRRLGYEREAMVSERGQFSVRGGILDVFPANAAHPVRIELDGETVASVRLFDTADQRSRERRRSARIMISDEFMAQKKSASLLDYLPGSAMVCVDEPAAVKDAAARLHGDGVALISFEEAIERARRFGLLFLSDIGEGIDELGDVERIGADTRSCAILAPAASPQGMKSEFWRGAFDRIGEWVGAGYEVGVYCNNEGERARLLELIGEKGSLLAAVEIGAVSSPFMVPELKLAFLSDSEIFGRYKVRRPRRRLSAVRFKALPAHFEPGDYVVHVDQGIGRYIGLRRLKREGGEREYLAIGYQGGAKLYVPIEQSHLVERYVGPGRRRPSLDILGSKRWTLRKARAQRAIVDFASELLELQALRSSLRGIQYSPDSAWQREFEASFIYEETPDQERAIEEVKADMERPVPMDRLICGDVGYGKTEVAIRAAFKAVMDGKQVAVLVPTTVLAQQHHNTFRDRLADYPIEVSVLSRFQSAAEQAETIEELISGRVDIVIGTHRLLQDDVLFKDLGLVVIDEEQRFGVTHKEKLKQLRKLVDVLTMTATPIPRTLYLATTGLRDMSVIDTPPQDRLAVQTEIAHYDDGTVRDAILRELAREGQVYYVHNRVATIGRVAGKIEALVPEARVAVAHGQMGEGILASTMEKFFAGEIDVLVCTTIIESGLDVPSVNTIFIDAAHRFGLADLYQLRGRVGRYKHRAFAYLLIPRGPIGDEGRRRLRAISEHSDLGAGFSIAMRDLEIRGAGNVLGRAQHGHITAVGFDLYCRLLKAAIEGLKGRKVAPHREVRVDIGPHPALPAEYVPAGRLRIDVYRRLAAAASEAEIHALREELRDRFGPLPDDAVLCLELARVKLLACRAGVRSIELAGDRLLMDSREGRIMEKAGSRSFRGVLRAAEKALKGLQVE